MTEPHKNHTLYCSFCILSAAYHSWHTLNEMLPEIGNEYRRNSDNINVNADLFALMVNSGQTDSAMEYLINSLLLDETNSFEAFMGVSRNVIERLSNINFLVKYKDKSRLHSYAELLQRSTKDIMVLLDPSEPAKLADEWKEEKWTSSSQQDRIDRLPNSTVKLLYGYISRVLHTINRDGLLASWQTEVFIKLYVLITIVGMYNDIHQLLPNEIAHESIKAKHRIFNELISGHWNTRSVEPFYLIALTSFGLEEGLLNGNNKEYLKSYMTHMTESAKHGVLPEPILVGS